MKKTIAVMTLAVVLLMTVGSPAFAGGEALTLLEDLEDIEMSLYGERLPGAIIDRLDQIEQDVFGQVETGSMVTRINRISSATGGAFGAKVSVAYKLAAVEWFLRRRVVTEPVMTKLEKLETIVLGGPGTGAMASRVDYLLAVCLPDGTLKTEDVTVTRGQPVLIKLLKKLDSSSTQKGQRVDIEIARDVLINSELVIPKGAKTYGVVTDVSPAGRLGKDGKIALELQGIKALDGTVVPLAFDEKTKQLNESLQWAIGAGLAGFIVFGPVGALGAVFVHGKDAVIPEGAEFYVAAGSDVKVHGMTLPVDVVVELTKDMPIVEIKPGK
ncbi:MAG TPA: hypothetical protein PK192_08830 [Bacillota bacterium]|mgnify:CR=1 FL=1|nr:hypothetical protein [Bacillota bacterium]HPZ93197.1 hypothetical protein [Bacillota bacterium]HXL03263.1 hypothetical protein [Bacillota bacterium]